MPRLCGAFLLFDRNHLDPRFREDDIKVLYSYYPLLFSHFTLSFPLPQESNVSCVIPDLIRDLSIPSSPFPIAVEGSLQRGSTLLRLSFLGTPMKIWLASGWVESIVV